MAEHSYSRFLRQIQSFENTSQSTEFDLRSDRLNQNEINRQRICNKFKNHYTERPKTETKQNNTDQIPKLELKRPNEPNTYVSEREIHCGKLKLVHKVVNVRKSNSTKSSK